MNRKSSSGVPGSQPSPMMTDHALSSDEIRAGLKSGFWSEIICCNAVSSTNDIGLALPLDDATENTGIAIIADSQEKGRGRFARIWSSPPGLNLYLSIVLKPDLPPVDAPFLTILAALASAAAIYRETRIQVSIKWPNDLLIAGRKLGGVLTEARTVQGVITRAVIGVGINLNSSAGDLPPELSGKATSVLMETGSTVSRARITTSILHEFESRYEELRAVGASSLVRELRPLLDCLGREVMVSDGASKISGFAEDIDDEGRLVLRLPSGTRKKIGSGEIIRTGDS